MLFERCNSYGAACPCVYCNKNATCGCTSSNVPDGYAVETDFLCNKAREHCEAVNSKEDGGNG